MSRVSLAHAQVIQGQPVEMPPRFEHGRRDLAAEGFGPVLNSVDCQKAIPCKSLNATYEWLKRHAIPRGRGHIRVYRHDLERELFRMARKPRGPMHVNSLRNLQRRTA